MSSSKSKKVKYGANTPPLNQMDREEYIKLHLFYELRWLLAAATEWSIQNQLKLGIGGYEVQVYAMDSAFLHARTLFEFFTKETGKNYYGADAFLGPGAVLASSSYTSGWVAPLHSHAMHAQCRSSSVPLNSFGVAKDLNQMPVDFAREILRLWKEFELMLGKSSDPHAQGLGQLARDKQEEAIKSAECVVNSTVAQRSAGDKHQLLKPVFAP